MAKPAGDSRWCDRRTLSFLAAIGVLSATAVALPQAANAQVSIRPGDTVWYISTDHLGYPTGVAPRLRVHQYDEGWQKSDTETIFASHDSQAVTSIYVNAARVSANDISARGFRLYRALARRAPDDTPLFHIIWSWPSPTTRRPLRDFRASLCRMDSHGYYVGWFLSQLDSDSQVSLIGYSFGAGVVAGSAHVLAGGSLAGQRLDTDSGPGRLRVVLWSPAIHNYWLLPGRNYGEAMSRIDRLYLGINSRDPVLKRYRFALRHARPAALGYTGMACRQQMGESLSRIRQENNACILGREHRFDNHIGSSYIMGRTLTYMLWEPVDGADDKPE